MQLELNAGNATFVGNKFLVVCSRLAAPLQNPPCHDRHLMLFQLQYLGDAFSGPDNIDFPEPEPLVRDVVTETKSKCCILRM